MSRFKAGLGVAILSALCICAISAANASALTLHECRGEEGTGVTCAPGEHWVKLGPGFHTIKVTSGGTSTLAATVAGVKFKIACTGESGSGEVANITGGSEGKAIFVSYEGCSVTEPAGKGCTVPSTITTESLKATSTTMATVYSPTAGSTEPFVNITVSGCSSEALNGKKAVTGSASSLTEEATPYTQEFTASSGSSLKFGGQAATFLSKNGIDTPSGVPIAGLTP